MMLQDAYRKSYQTSSRAATYSGHYLTGNRLPKVPKHSHSQLFLIHGLIVVLRDRFEGYSHTEPIVYEGLRDTEVKIFKYIQYSLHDPATRSSENFFSVCSAWISMIKLNYQTSDDGEPSSLLEAIVTANISRIVEGAEFDQEN